MKLYSPYLTVPHLETLYSIAEQRIDFLKTNQDGHLEMTWEEVREDENGIEYDVWSATYTAKTKSSQQIVVSGIEASTTREAVDIALAHWGLSIDTTEVSLTN